MPVNCLRLCDSTRQEGYYTDHLMLLVLTHVDNDSSQTPGTVW